MIEKAFIDRCLWIQPFGKDRTAFNQNEIPINIFNMTLEILWFERKQYNNKMELAGDWF